MKLAFSIPGKIWWIHNFLDYEMYKGIHNAIIKERNKINLHTTDGIWDNHLITNITPPLRTEVSNYTPFEKLKTLVKFNPYFQITDIEHMSTNIHFMKKGAGINWHNDGGWKYGATYYVNRRWNKNWGGEFMFSDGTGSGFLPYVGNSLAIIKSPINHKVNPVITDIMPRLSIQIFMK